VKQPGAVPYRKGRSLSSSLCGVGGIEVESKRLVGRRDREVRASHAEGRYVGALVRRALPDRVPARPREDRGALPLVVVVQQYAEVPDPVAINVVEEAWPVRDAALAARALEALYVG